MKKSQNLVLLLIMIALINFVIANDDIEDDHERHLENTFTQLKKFPRIIVQPPETIKVPLDEYYRGQKLNYRLDLFEEDGTFRLIDNNVFSITEGIKEQHFVDFEQRAEEQSLPQTSLILTDEYQNKYLIFIDFTMHLNIYNISNYFLSQESSKAIPRISRVDLYNKDYYISPDRQCNNLIQLDKNLLMANCKSNVPTKADDVAVSIEIDITDMKKVQTYYQISGFQFNEMKDGKLVLLGRVNKTYNIIMKRNNTNCYLDLIGYERNNPIKYYGKIKSFTDPQPFKEQKDHVNKRLEQVSMGCIQPPVIDIDSPVIDYLQIKDVKVIDYYENTIVASDYNYGLLFWNIDCYDEITGCLETPLYRLKVRELGAITILKPGNVNNERTLFVQVLYPPQIYEVNLELDSRPFVAKTYRIPQDLNQYVSIDLIGANSEYLFTKFISVKNFKPVLRIYKRKASFFSLMHTQIELDEFIDSGFFAEFISPNENFFLLKTSDYFKIYKFQNTQLVIKASNITHLTKLQYLDHPFRLRMTITNYTMSELTTMVDVLFINRTNMTSYAIYEGSKADDQLLGFEIQYSCGARSARLNIDPFFSGPRDDVKILKQTLIYKEEFFKIDSRRIGDNFRVIDYWVKNCNLNALLRLSVNQIELSKRYLGCVEYNSSKILILDAFSKFKTFEELVKTEFTIPNARIVEFSVDEAHKMLILFSDQTVEGESGAVIHFFKLYNVLTWDSSLSLNKEYPNELGNFRFRSYDPISFAPSYQLGNIISQPILTKSNTKIVQIVIFDLQSQAMIQKFSLRGIINVKLPNDSKSNVNVVQVRFASDFIWVLLSNNTFFVYQQYITLYNNPSGREMIKLYRILEFKETDPVLQGNIFNFHMKDNYLICFFKNRNVAIYQYEFATLELEQVMVLPMYLDSYPDTDYSFVINKLKQKVVYEIHNQFLIILYQKSFMGLFDGYTVFIYNIYERRHNSLLGRYDIPGVVDNIDETLVKLQVIDLSPEKLRITIITEETKLVHFDTVLYTNLVTDEANLPQLNQLCRNDNDVVLSYVIYPEDNPKERINVDIYAQNQGLIIYKDIEQDNLTISIEKMTDDQTGTFYGKYQMLQNFHGENIKYDLNCTPKSEDNQGNICKDLRIDQTTLEYNRSIEFVSSHNPIQGFFVVEPVLLFFDRNYVRAYYQDTQHYDAMNLDSIFRYIDRPKDYYMFKFEEDNSDPVYYLAAVNDLYFLSLTKIIAKDPSKTYIQNRGHFNNFGDKVLIMPVEDVLVLPTNISSIELYQKYYDSFTAILVFDSAFVDTQSAIQFYDIEIIDESIVTYNLLSHVTLSANSLYLDTFKISTIQLYKNSPLLVLAIENYGVMIYDVSKFKIVQVVSIKSQTFTSQFRITNIVFQSLMNIKLLIPSVGVISLMFDDESLSTQPTLKSIKVEETIPLTYKQLAAVGHSGFAYLEATRDEQGSHSHLRFYSWDSLSNTKSLGSYTIADNQFCRFLQEPSTPFIRSYFKQDITNDYQCVALICGSTLKIVSFNFHPSLILSTKDTYTQEINMQQIEIKGSNDYSEDTFNMNIVILKQSRAVASGYYIAFLVILGLLLMLLFRQKRAKFETQIKKQSEEQSKTKRISSGGFLSEFFNRNKSYAVKNNQAQVIAEEFKGEDETVYQKSSIN